MRFIELTGETLSEVVKEDELHVADLSAAGVQPNSIVRINEQGDIELRRPDGWDVIGGLLGEFKERVPSLTGLNWA